MRTISRLTDPVVSKPCTVDQLAEYLDATTRFVRNEIAAGRLRARRLSARLIRILPSDLQQWLDASGYANQIPPKVSIYFQSSRAHWK
jgi:excisionase family DNA binding protein